MTRTFTNRYCAGTPLYLALTMAYEIYYAFICTTIRFERAVFSLWFCFDVSFVMMALMRAYKKEQRSWMVKMLVVGTALGIWFLWGCGRLWPDEREQLTAYWTGPLLELPIGWSQVYLLLKRGDTKGQSLEIW
jgi:hypothetical protein